MLFYMTCSLTISLCLNVYNRKIQLRERYHGDMTAPNGKTGLLEFKPKPAYHRR